MRSTTWGALVTLAMAACGGAEPAPEEHVEDAAAANVVVLDSAQLTMIDLVLAQAGPLAPDTLHLTGSVTFEPSRVSHVGPRMQGRIREVMVEIGSPIDAGDTLAVLDSPELAVMQAAWFQAAVARDVATRNHERVERLARDGIASERRRLEAEAELRQREAEVAAAGRGLVALGAEPDSSASSLFVLRSPLTGIVVDKHATSGEVVGADAELFTVGDLSRVWLMLDLYELDLARVGVGVPAIVTAEAYPGRQFPARVGYVGAVVDTVSRTVDVRVEIENRDRSLKPGMFARAALVLREEGGAIGVPAGAVQRLGDRNVVFLPVGAGRFDIRDVELGPARAGDFVEILGGLAAGESVVAAGSFALKAQLESGSFGEGH
jgi:cobalt-zinc-cadmium efflux system membrane fusion protein